jgi:hypothetical protein
MQINDQLKMLCFRSHVGFLLRGVCILLAEEVAQTAHLKDAVEIRSGGDLELLLQGVEHPLGLAVHIVVGAIHIVGEVLRVLLHSGLVEVVVVGADRCEKVEEYAACRTDRLRLLRVIVNDDAPAAGICKGT